MYETKQETTGLRGGLDTRNRRNASSAYQRRFFTTVREAAQACKEKVPAHVGKRARAIVKTSTAMTMRF